MTKDQLEAQNATLTEDLEKATAKIAELEAGLETLKSELDAANIQIEGGEIRTITAEILPGEIHEGLRVIRRIIRDGKMLGGATFSRKNLQAASSTLSYLEALKVPSPTVIPVVEETDGQEESEQ